IAQIGQVIAGLRDRGDMAIVLVEQFFDFAWDLGDRFLVMERGRAVLQGPKSDLARADLHARLAGHASA
ncbi:urea ABC transporter ATP-binding protein, partial [Paracoccus sp. S4493]